MNVKLPAVLLVVAVSVRLLAAEPAGDILLKASSIVVDGQRVIATDEAILITKKNSEDKITADKIVYDQSTSIFTLTGHVKIQAGRMTVETNEAMINAAGQRVFQLTSGQISISGGLPVDADAPASKLPDFSKPLPKTETKLPGSR